MKAMRWGLTSSWAVNDRSKPRPINIQCEGLLERMTYRGKLYAVPQVMDVQLLVYRRSMLTRAGIKPPSTFDQLATAASALTNKHTKGLFVGNDGGVGVLAGPALWSVGSDYLTAADGPGFCRQIGRAHV